MIREERIIKEFSELVSIDSPSYKEREMADALKEKLKAIGFTVKEDEAGAKIGGNAGNIYAYMEGELNAEPILFCCHMDTVEPSRGKQAVVREDGTITSSGETVLGSDDLSGVVDILEAIRHLKEEGIPHRPFEVVLMVAEEVFGKGAKAYDYEGWPFRSKEAYVLDMSGPVGSATVAGPSIVGWEARIKGLSAHAGFNPEKGVNAISAASRAIALLTPGWVDEETTMAVGTIKGGKANNIVPDQCIVTGEARSLNHTRALEVVEGVAMTFMEQAGQAEVDFVVEPHIIAYETPEDHPVIKRFKRACDKLGLPGQMKRPLGGSDNNILVRHGLAGTVLSTGMTNVHTCQEYIPVEDLQKGAKLLAELLTDEE